MIETPAMQSTDDESREVAQAWMRAVRRDDVARELAGLFERAKQAISQRGPACWASGRCCNFAKAGHRLYVTGLEAAWTVSCLPQVQAPAPSDSERAASTASIPLPVLRAEPQGFGQAHMSSHTQPSSAAPPLTHDSIALARARGDCPFLIANACSVHDIKPLACRVYFCDVEAQTWQHALSEELHDGLRALHERFDIPYRYAEWRDLLTLLVPART